MPSQTPVVKRETFAPLLYVLTYSEPEEAIALQNGVPKGLASSIFTTDLREAERFLAVSRASRNAALRELSLEAARLARRAGDVTYTAVRRELQDARRQPRERRARHRG